MAMHAGDHDTGLSAESEHILSEIPRDGCDSWWVPSWVMEELLTAELVQVWEEDGIPMIGPL